MRFLVFAEQHDGEFVKNSLGVLSKAASLGDADAVVVGADAALASELGKHGAVRKTKIAHDEVALRANRVVDLGGNARREQHRGGE